MPTTVRRVDVMDTRFNVLTGRAITPRYTTTSLNEEEEEEEEEEEKHLTYAD